MRTLVISLTIVIFLLSCERNNNTTSAVFTAKISGYDLNCSTCILSFPFDSTAVEKEIGSSPENLYHAVNLNKNDLMIGQMLKVEVRKAEPDEVTACITLYPSLPFENVYVTSVEDFDSYNSNDTILLPLKECKFNAENQSYICFESVISDSRCPEGAQCIWAGDAKVKFKYARLDQDPVFFSLNTTLSFTNDSIIDGYRYTLLNLHPYPSLMHPAGHKDCKAELKVEKATE